MSVWDVAGPLLALAIGARSRHFVMRRRRTRRRAARVPGEDPLPVRRPASCRERALQATLRLAWAEQATVVPAYLATVPMQLALDVPVGKSCEEAFDVFEAIEQRAARIGVPVDGRIARGRNVRHALRHADA